MLDDNELFKFIKEIQQQTAFIDKTLYSYFKEAFSR